MCCGRQLCGFFCLGGIRDLEHKAPGVHSPLLIRRPKDAVHGVDEARHSGIDQKRERLTERELDVELPPIFSETKFVLKK